MANNAKGASKKVAQRHGMPKVLKTFLVVEEEDAVKVSGDVVSTGDVVEDYHGDNLPEVDMEPVASFWDDGGDIGGGVVGEVVLSDGVDSGEVLPPLESLVAPPATDVDTSPVEVEVEDVVEAAVVEAPGVEETSDVVKRSSSVRRGGVSIRQLMAERASEASAAMASVLSDGSMVGVKAALAARGVSGSKQGVKQAVRSRMHGGDALRGQNKCTTKVIG